MLISSICPFSKIGFHALDTKFNFVIWEIDKYLFCNLQQYSICLLHFNSFTKRQILDSSKLKEFADDNFKFDENGKKFSK